MARIELDRLGYDRKPKKGYRTLQECYQPMLIGMNVEREAILSGRDRGGHPRPIVIRPWVVSDRHAALENCTYSVCLRNDLQTVEAHQEQAFTIPMDGVLEHTPSITILEELPPGDYELELTLRELDQVISTNRYDIKIVPVP